MDTDIETGPIPVLGQADEQPDTLLDQLAAKRDAVAENKETFVPVPGYDSGEPPFLLIKYRLLDGAEITRIVSHVRDEFRNQWERGLYSAVDTFILAVTGVYVDKGDGIPVPLTVQGQDVLGFTPALAQALGFAGKIEDPSRPRDVVFGLFANNDVAVTQHNYMLNRWFGNTSLKVSRELFEGNL